MKTNEIKEILDYFRKYMCIEDCIKLSKIEDYITNLQEENEQLKEYIKVAKVSEWFKGNDKLDKLLGDDNEKDI